MIRLVHVCMCVIGVNETIDCTIYDMMRPTKVVVQNHPYFDPSVSMTISEFINKLAESTSSAA